MSSSNITLKNTNKRNVFLTGATGTMGMAAVKEFSTRLDRFNLILLARDSKKNRKLLEPYLNDSVSVIWGDLLDRASISEGVRNADFILHVGGKVSPAADYNPSDTFKVNTLAMRYIVEEVKSNVNRDNIGVVYIGSVAQCGPHNPPYHWGRTGETLYPAKMDGYALSKIAAERILSDSGLKKWVSLRQTGILSKAMLLNATDPISFHVPVKGVLEWVTVEDSGRLLANVCENDVPADFWNKFYNISSGKEYRFTNYEFEARLMKVLKCPPPEKVFDVRWFATDNFHGMWYTDSDKLEEILHFRSGITPDEYFEQLAKQLPWYFSLTPLVPAFVMKAAMKWVAGRNHLAPLYWKKNNIAERIEAHFGSIKEWEDLPGWELTDLKSPSMRPLLRKRCFNDDKPLNRLSIDDMSEAAKFYGGRCLDKEMLTGDLLTPLRWVTADGQEFSASPASVLLGGHWGVPPSAEDIKPILMPGCY